MGKKVDTEWFIKKAKEKFGNKFDYSKTVYKSMKTPVTITCPIHGDFEQTPLSHLKSKYGCPRCAVESGRIGKENFIKRAKEIFGDKYDYSKVEYVNNLTNVVIICPKHGEFKMTPGNHLAGKGCIKCGFEKLGNERRITNEEYIRRAQKVHGDKYDYSKLSYKSNKEKVCIICPIHGEFWIKPNNHVKLAQGCPKCRRIVNDIDEFLQKAKEVHKDKYDYSNVEYKDNKTKVCIICPEHGEFWQTPLHHLSGENCPKCAKKFMDKDYYINRARKIFGNTYDYSKMEYKNMKTKICVTCKEHGDFWIYPMSHLVGGGCPKCKQSSMEKKVSTLLDEHNIKYELQKRFKWLGIKRLDFYLPDYNVGIECQGLQHFRPVKFNRSQKETKEELFEINKRRDKEKLDACNENGVKIYYYSNLGIEYPYQVYENFDELLNAIINDYSREKID